MSVPSERDMPPDEFREWGRAAVDWIADYLESVDVYPVLARVHPGQIRARLPDRAPEKPEPFEEIFEDFNDLIIPGITHWNHPGFQAFFAVTGSGPGILGELLAAALNVNAMIWESSPAGTELELHVLDWLRELLGLPEEFVGVIQDTASTSTLVALSAARHRLFPEARDQGLFGLPPSRIYASEEAHSSVEKAAIVLGLGRGGLRRIAVDREFRMVPEALRDAIREDEEQGIRPMAIVATLGTTSTGSVDPVDRAADIAARFGLWLHVDAAYAGASAILPELRGHFEGWERADSVVFNPHKWLFTPADCSVLLTRASEEVKGASALTPDYLRTANEALTTNLMDYGIALGRRFRALKLWFVLRYFGAEGLRQRIREHLRIARTFADWVDAEPGWERIAPVRFSTVAFWFAPGDCSGEDQDERNLTIMGEVNSSGEAYLSHTKLGSRVALRLAVGNLRTTERHVQRTWTLLKDATGQERSSL